MITYKPEDAFDGDPETARWVAGGGKEEPPLLLEYEEPIRVSRVAGAVPGYAEVDPTDSTDRFCQLYVVREASIEFSGGSSMEADFEWYRRMQYVEAPLGTETASVRITILDTHPPGNKPDGPPYPPTARQDRHLRDRGGVTAGKDTLLAVLSSRETKER